MAPSIPQNPTPAQALALLPKLSDADADLRYMSLNDLYNTLNAGASTFLVSDYHTSAKIIDGVLQTLDDQNGEVQNQAIKWCDLFILSPNPAIDNSIQCQCSRPQIASRYSCAICSQSLEHQNYAFGRHLDTVYGFEDLHNRISQTVTRPTSVWKVSRCVLCHQQSFNTTFARLYSHPTRPGKSSQPTTRHAGDRLGERREQ